MYTLDTDFYKPRIVILNIADLKFELIRNFAEQMLRAAEFMAFNGKVYHSRIIFFKTDNPEEERVIALEQMYMHYRKYLDAGIAEIATNEVFLLERLDELLLHTKTNI